MLFEKLIGDVNIFFESLLLGLCYLVGQSSCVFSSLHVFKLSKFRAKTDYVSYFIFSLHWSITDSKIGHVAVSLNMEAATERFTLWHTQWKWAWLPLYISLRFETRKQEYAKGCLMQGRIMSVWGNAKF